MRTGKGLLWPEATGLMGILMDRVGKKLYRSGAWKKLRQAYLSEHPMCERCARVGRIRPATQVHHKIHLTPENVDDPNIALNMSNLESLCDECHAKEHHSAGEVAAGLQFDAEGNLFQSPRVSQK